MRIVAAMSGGVDSSVTAALLKEQGHEVIGVHMKLHEGAATGTTGHCCGLDDAWDARRVADRLEIPFYVLNLEDAFREAVVDPFAKAWRAGLTPNPCVTCNGVLKFRVLLRRALSLGAEALATGHYARTHEGRLFEAVDTARDQSYFLYPVPTAALHKTLFPLGGMTKPEVRAHAERLGLVTAGKPDSMEVCFIPDDNHARFVQDHAQSEGTELDGAGNIVDEAGQVLGTHEGYFRYTVGQRRGLGLAGGPYYVLEVRPDSRQVVVGPDSRLQAQSLVARDLNWLRPPEACVGAALHARIRHKGARIPARITSLDPVVLEFSAMARAISPGQSVVLYDGEEVVAGGTIVRSGLPTQSALQA